MITRAALFCLLTFFLGPALAGARGFTVVIINIGDDRFFDTKGYVAWRDGNYKRNDNSYRCWQQRASGVDAIENTIRKEIPSGLSKDLAVRIWGGDRVAMAEAQNVVTKRRSKRGTEIDGVYILKYDGDSVSVMALGARLDLGAKNPTSKISVPWVEAEPEKTALEFDIGLCRAAGPISYGFIP